MFISSAFICCCTDSKHNNIGEIVESTDANNGTGQREQRPRPIRVTRKRIDDNALESIRLVITEEGNTSWECNVKEGAYRARRYENSEEIYTISLSGTKKGDGETLCMLVLKVPVLHKSEKTLPLEWKYKKEHRTDNRRTVRIAYNKTKLTLMIYEPESKMRTTFPLPTGKDPEIRDLKGYIKLENGTIWEDESLSLVGNAWITTTDHRGKTMRARYEYREKGE